MTKNEAKPAIAAVNELFARSPDGLREIVRAVMQEMLEAEMTDALGAEKGERTAARLGYRSGYYTRTLVTRVGKLELRVPQDRDGRFSTELFERYQRSEQALVATLAEMYVQGVSTRKSLPSGLTRGSRRSPRSYAATPSRPPPSPPSTNAWTKASTPLPSAPSPSLSLTSSSTLVMKRCARAAWS
jgi:Transposase, Mutator family